MYEDGNILELLDRYRNMRSNNELYFFDVEEFESIIEHFMAVSDYEEALSVINMAENQHPNTPAFMLKRVRYLMNAQRMDEANSALTTAEHLDPNNDELLKIKAHMLSLKGKHNEAIALLKEALDLAEDPLDIYAHLASEYQILNDYTNAIVYLKKILDEFPEDEIAIYNIASCYDALDDVGDSITFFKSFIEVNPYSELGWFHLGITYARAAMYQDALEAFEYSTICDEYFTAAYYEMARVHENLEDYNSAINTYLSSIEFEDPTGYIYYRLGHCYLNLKNIKQAARYLKRAVREDEELDEAHMELAALLADTGDNNGALFHLNKSLALDPENPDYLYTATEIFEQLKFPLEAVTMYERIIALEFDDDEMYMDYAELLVELDDVDEALKQLISGVKRFPHCEDLHLMLAGYMLATGDNFGAVSHLSEASALSHEALDKFAEYFPELLTDQNVQIIIQGLK